MALRLLKRNRTGMAALFDALMFLTVMSIVSVTVLVAFAPPHGQDKDIQTYVERCHAVLLGTTLRSWSETSQRFMPVADAMATLLLIKKPLPDRIRAEIDSVLEGMFAPQYTARWTCSMGETSYALGPDANVTGDGGNLFVSSIQVPTPSGLCSYVLTA